MFKIRTVLAKGQASILWASQFSSSTVHMIQFIAEIILFLWFWLAWHLKCEQQRAERHCTNRFIWLMHDCVSIFDAQTNQTTVTAIELASAIFMLSQKTLFHYGDIMETSHAYPVTGLARCLMSFWNGSNTINLTIVFLFLLHFAQNWTKSSSTFCFANGSIRPHTLWHDIQPNAFPFKYCFKKLCHLSNLTFQSGIKLMRILLIL